jgi:hypothetical protein
VSRLPARVSLNSARLVGRVEPRLWSKPLRPLTRHTTRGFEVIDFAEMIGRPLLPWQKWLVKHALELNPDGTYRFRTVLVLVARQNGKSDVKRTVSLWRLYLDEAMCILGIAQDLALARKQMNLSVSTIFDSPDLATEYAGTRKANGDEYFWLDDGSLPKNAPTEMHPMYIIRAANRRAARGLSIDELNIDELREQTDWDAWSAASKATLARAYAQIWCMSNQGDDTSVVLNQLRDAALSGRDPQIGLFEWSAPEGCALDDPKAIAQANPGLGTVIQLPAILSALGTDPPNVYRTEVLCQKVDILDGPFDIEAWKRCVDPTMKAPAGRNVVACFDRSEEGHSTLAVCELGSDGLPRVAIRKAWTSDDAVRAELPALLGELRPMVLAWYPAGPAAALATILRPKTKDGRLQPGRIKVVELVGGKAAEAVQGFADLMKGGGIVWNGDPLLDAHVRGSQKQPAGDGGFKIVRRGGGNVEAAYAAAGAIQTALTNPRRSLTMKVVS